MNTQLNRAPPGALHDAPIRAVGARSIADWLISIGMTRYVDAFVRNHIDGELLAGLSEHDLEKIGITSLGHRRKLLRAIADWKQMAPLLPNGVTASAPAAERRNLTIMFCDLVGATALSRRLDPEELRDVIRAYHTACAQPIARYEGVIAKFMGDGILAYFGFPRAHEDDAERAVRAGLATVAAVSGLTWNGVNLSARVGIATGLVVVGDLIGTGSAQEQAVIGETPNLAARLQDLAEPGHVVVATATRRLLGRVFAVRNIGRHALKGFAESVEAWAVEGAFGPHSRFEATRVSELTDFVGRMAEVARLLELQRLAFQGRGQAVLLIGEAGIGKSRLAAAITGHFARRPNVILRCQCSPHHSDSPLYPIIGLLERSAAFASGDSADQRLDKLERLLTRDAPRDRIALLAELLAIPVGDRYAARDAPPTEWRQLLLRALLDSFEDLARRGPVLCIVEDAQWADATTLELLDLAMDRILGLPVFVIVTSRTELEQLRRGRSHVAPLPLGRLERADIRNMIASVADGRVLPPAAMDEIIDRTDGVPLFIEEFTKTVLETARLAHGEPTESGPGFAIPATLRDSLMARIDHLAPEKTVAQTAAVIGREFSVALLERLVSLPPARVQSGLDQLESAGLILRLHDPAGQSYMFKHALVRDAAYESLLRSARIDIHARIGAVLERGLAAGTADAPEILAHHFSSAGLALKAVPYWLKAGRSALERSALAEAVGHLKKGLALIAGLADDDRRAAIELQLQAALAQALAPLRGYSAGEVAEAYGRARALCDRAGDADSLFIVRFGLARYDWVRGHLASARRDAEELLKTAERAQDPARLLIAHSLLGSALWHIGDNRNAATHIYAARRFIADAHHASAIRAYSLDARMMTQCFLEHVLINSGRPEQGFEAGNAAIVQARRDRQASTLCGALAFRAASMLPRNDPASVFALVDECIAIASEVGLVHWLAIATGYRGWAMARTGAAAEGLAHIRRAIAIWHATGAAVAFPAFLAALAEAQMAGGHATAAIATTDEALTLIARDGERQWVSVVHSIRGDILNSIGDLVRAEAEYETGLSIARLQAGHAWALRAALGLAKLWRRQDKQAEARALLASVSGVFTESTGLPDLIEARKMIGELGAAT